MRLARLVDEHGAVAERLLGVGLVQGAAAALGEHELGCFVTVWGARVAARETQVVREDASCGSHQPESASVVAALSMCRVHQTRHLMRMSNLTTSISNSAEHLRAQFDEYGVLVFEDYLEPAVLRELNDAISAHYNPIVRERFGVDAIGVAGVDFECEVISWDPITEGVQAFRRLGEQGELATITEALIGPGYSSPRGLVMWSVGGGKGQAWHQDCPPDQPAAYNVNRLFYMQNTAQEDGAIVVVPGSHRMGRISRGGPQEPIAGEIVLTPSAGTMVFLHGHVYHRVTPNVSKKPRVSVNLRAYPAGVSADVNRIGIYRNGAYDFQAGVKVDA